MHQKQWIQTIIMGNDYSMFHRPFWSEWMCHSVANAYDSMGVLLMGGEL